MLGNTFIVRIGNGEVFVVHRSLFVDRGQRTEVKRKKGREFRLPRNSRPNVQYCFKINPFVFAKAGRRGQIAKAWRACPTKHFYAVF
jgi:hypothetical protein